MSEHGIPFLGWLLVTAFAVVTPAWAEQNFDHLAGSWTGAGSMQPKDGPRERVRCKVIAPEVRERVTSAKSFFFQGSGACGMPMYPIEQAGRVVSER